MSGGGGMADTPDSNSGAARREGSNPSPRTAAEKLQEWNKQVFDEAKQKAEERFDALLLEHQPRRIREDVPTLF